MLIPARTGDAPEVSNDGPQRQLTDIAPASIWGLLIAQVFALPHVVEWTSSVSPISSRAVLFDDLREVRTPQTSLAPDGPLEPVHVHGVFDTSAHLCLPADRGAEIGTLGWAVPHQYGDFGTELFVYGPRDSDELVVVLQLVKESLAFARANN